MDGSGLLVPRGKVCAGVSHAQDQVSLVFRGCGRVACAAGYKGALPGVVSLLLQISGPSFVFPSFPCLLSLCFSEVLIFVLTFLQ